MRHSSLLHQMRRHVWTPSIAGSSRPLILLLKMVCFGKLLGFCVCLAYSTYLTFKTAGIPISKCSGSDTSVYTGCFTNDYLSILQQDYNAEQRHAAMGIAPSMLANRLSWFFNFKGTSMNLDSACSSSLIALHLACQDLRAKNSKMVLSL